MRCSLPPELTNSFIFFTDPLVVVDEEATPLIELGAIFS